MDYPVEIVETYDLTYPTATKICITLRCKKKVMEKGKSMTIYTYPIVVALSPHRLVLKVNLSTSVTPALKFWLCLFLVLALFSSSETRSHRPLLNKSNRALMEIVNDAGCGMWKYQEVKHTYLYKTKNKICLLGIY